MFLSGGIQGFQRQSDCTLLNRQDLGERWACLATFFLPFGLVDSPRGTPGTCTRRQQGFFSCWSVQPRGLLRWHQSWWTCQYSLWWLRKFHCVDVFLSV